MSDTSNIMASSRRRIALICAAVVIAMAAGDALFHSQLVHAQLQSWKLIPTSEQFTELYFDNNLSLPTTLTSQSLQFDFSVHNVTGQSVVYPYNVVMTDAHGKQTILTTGSLDLPSGQVATVPVIATVPTGTLAAEISVSLPVQQESIDFRTAVK
jgi:hypothetical protein